MAIGEGRAVRACRDTVATVGLEGSDVAAALEEGVGQVEEGAGRFPQGAGMRYSFDATAPAGSRITAVEIQTDAGFAPIDGEATYGVVSNNYMRSGGDGYKVFATNGQNAYDFGPGLEQVVADYLAANSPYTPTLRGNVIDAAVQTAPETTEAPAPASEEPAPAAAEADTGETTTYVVKSGDTLWKIARSQLGDATLYTKIVELNDLASGVTLSIGQELKLPK